MKIAIIEDELQARKLTIQLLRTCFKEIEIVGEAVSIIDGVNLINNTKPDLVLLDIQLADGNGFEILDRISFKQFKIIFITSYSDFAIKAFKYGAVNYLLKPYAEEDFIEAINRMNSEKLVDSITNLNISLDSIKSKKKIDKISIPTVSGFEILNLFDIICFEAIPEQIALIRTNGKRIRINKFLNEYEELLKDDGFERVHKSFLVNISHIKNYILNEIGGILVLSNNKEVPVSRRKKSLVLNYLKNK